MTGTLARFEEDGRIERRPDPADHRSVHVHAVGVDRLIEVCSRVNEKLAEHVPGWPMEQVRVITRLLAGVGDIVTAFSEGVTTEWES